MLHLGQFGLADPFGYPSARPVLIYTLGRRQPGPACHSLTDASNQWTREVSRKTSTTMAVHGECAGVAGSGLGVKSFSTSPL
jgi:hypothetical protein